MLRDQTDDSVSLEHCIHIESLPDSAGISQMPDTPSFYGFYLSCPKHFLLLAGLSGERFTLAVSQCEQC